MVLALPIGQARRHRSRRYRQPAVGRRGVRQGALTCGMPRVPPCMHPQFRACNSDALGWCVLWQPQPLVPDCAGTATARSVAHLRPCFEWRGGWGVGPCGGAPCCPAACRAAWLDTSNALELPGQLACGQKSGDARRKCGSQVGGGLETSPVVRRPLGIPAIASALPSHSRASARMEEALANPQLFNALRLEDCAAPEEPACSSLSASVYSDASDDTSSDPSHQPCKARRWGAAMPGGAPQRASPADLPESPALPSTPTGTRAPSPARPPRPPRAPPPLPQPTARHGAPPTPPRCTECRDGAATTSPCRRRATCWWRPRLVRGAWAELPLPPLRR